MSGTTIHRNALPAGAMLHEYRLESVLGAGAFGMTYLARDTHLDKAVAIKEYMPPGLAVRALDGSVLPIATDQGPDYQWGLDRFLLEARTLGRFSHPNIVRVNRYFEANGTAYMVMDYERGTSLSGWLKSAAAPDEARLRAWLMPLLDGLEAVHEAGILHRDIKPANVFIRANGAPVLLDFGAARQALGDATRSLTAVLTPGYAPLEQYASDGNQGPWSDLYAMAGVVYRVLTGENPPEAVSRIRHDVVPEKLRAARGRAGDALLKAVEWAMAMDEKLRPRNVAEWRRAVTGAAQPREAAAPAPTPAAAGSAKALPAGGAPTGARLQDAATARRSPPRPGAGSAGGRPSRPWRWAGVAVVLAVAVAWTAAWNRQPRPDTPAAAPGTREPAAAQGGGPASAASGREAAGSGPGAVKEPYARFAQGVPERPPRERIDRPYADERQALQLREQALREFRAADADGDGYLSRDEGRRFPVLVKAFDVVDADGDGRISPQEFVDLRRQQAQQLKLKQDANAPHRVN